MKFKLWIENIAGALTNFGAGIKEAKFARVAALYLLGRKQEAMNTLGDHPMKDQIIAKIASFAGQYDTTGKNTSAINNDPFFQRFFNTQIKPLMNATEQQQQWSISKYLQSKGIGPNQYEATKLQSGMISVRNRATGKVVSIDPRQGSQVAIQQIESIF